MRARAKASCKDAPVCYVATPSSTWFHAHQVLSILLCQLRILHGQQLVHIAHRGCRAEADGRHQLYQLQDSRVCYVPM